MTAAQPWPAVRRRVAPYEEAAPIYDRWKWQEFWRRNELPRLRDLLQREPVVATALDVGAGTGALSALLAERAGRVVAVDASRAMLSVLTASRVTATAVQGDAERLPLRSGLVDRIGSARLLSHLDDPLTFFREACRVSRRGAALVVSDLHPAFDYTETTFGLGNAACSAPFAPVRHPLARVEDAAEEAGFVVEELTVYARDSLLWHPPPGTFATLDANDGPIFYVALLRRR